MTSDHAVHWDLDPTVIHLNHGSFGAAPREVLAVQARWRRDLESNTMGFFRNLAGHLDDARDALAAFLGTRSSALAFVPNASTGVNAVLRSLEFSPGDEILVTNHGYGAATNAASYVAERSGAGLVVAAVPGAPQGVDEIVDAILTAVSERTRLALIDHVTSPTAVVFPLERIIDELHRRGIKTLVDGAHAPGMLELDLDALGSTYYVGNCHKWVCAPKGAGFLHVADEIEADALVPVVVGWGRTSRPEGRSRFHSHFDWVGTADPTAYLSVPAAIDLLGTLLPGGWPALRKRNHELVVAARRLLCHRLGIAAAIPESMLGSMATIPLPPGPPPTDLLAGDLLQQHLIEEGFEVPISHGPEPGMRWLRVSAHAYNSMNDYTRLAEKLAQLRPQ